MDELGVTADGYYFGADLPKGLVLLCQSSELRSSNEGEICGIEEEDGPFPGGLKRGKADLAEITGSWLEGLNFEVGNQLSYTKSRGMFTHGRPPYIGLLVSYLTR